MEPNHDRTPAATSNHKNDVRFLEDSLIKTPDPQACSTVNRQRDLNVSPVQEINSNPIETADERNFLVDERNTIGELHQKINQMFDVFKRESISSNLQSAFSEVNSSLGILKVDDLEDFNDADSSKVLESLLPKKVDDCEASWRMKRELARQSMSSQPSLGMEKPVNEFSFTNDWEAKGGVYNPFDGEKVSGQLCFDEQFDSGGSAKQRLLEDEANWMLTNADIPVANTDRSLSGIFTGDDAAVNISSASSYLRCGSGPIGTLGGGRDQALRPHFGTEIFSPVKELDNTGCMADVLPECSVNQSTADAGLDLSVSSIASVTQIKEMLCEMGQNSPTLIINKLMNAEGRKKAKQTNRMDALKKTASAYKRKENISIIDLTDDEKKAGSDRPNQTNEIIDLSSTIDNFQQMKPFASPQRGVLQDMTNLPRSPIKIVDLETNATIMDSSILKRDVESGKGVAGLRSAAANNEREMNFSNLEISSDSFVVGPLSRSTSIEDIGKAINASSCNSSMIDGADDNIKLRYCIGSICTVMVTLSNSSLTNDVHCSISLIEVLKDKQLCPKAVKAVFPDDVKLSPGESKRVEVQLIPFAIGLLDIALQVDEVEESSEAVRSFICTVTMKSEKPRLIISKVSDSADYLDNSQIDFGLLPEESLRKSVVSIENVGHVKVPINITVCHNTSKLQVFHLQEDDKSEVVEKLVILDPGERLEEAVYCFTPALEHSNTTKTKYNITGELCVSLASVVRETLKFGRFNLSATVGYTRLLISPSCNPLQVPAFDRRPLLIRNASVLPLTLNLLLDANEFALECDVIRLDANQDATIMVEFSPLHFKNNLERAGRLWLSIDSTETRYQVDLIGQCTVNHDLITSSTSTGERSMARPKSVDSVMSSASKATTPCTSRSSSPCSSNLSSAEKGSLDLASTHSALVWASCPLQIAERKGCVLRNKNNYREKLLLTIVDNSGCFKLVEEKGNPVQEMRINLEGIESRQVTVSYCPLQVGACKASLVITRANQKSVCGQPNRKVLHLYGYGGKAVLNIRGVNKDPESKMWMYLDPDEIRAQFTLENSGDGTAFVRISQDMADTGVMITPQEALIAAHKKITVDLSFSPTTGRADHLLAKSEDSDVLVVTRLKIMFGDEATRLRLKRLYRKMINDRMGMDSLLMERLSVLDNLFPGSSSTEISCLKDTQASMKTLWVEGIREASVGVMLEKSALENAQLDATAQFIDLATTVTDDTVYVPKQQLIVAPRVVNLSWTQPSASFTLRNTTVLPIRVKMECPAGLTVDPAGPHTLDSHSSCAVTVTRRSHSADNMAATAASSLLRIYSDCTDPIEVPVNWNKVTRLADRKGEPANGRGDVYSTDYNVDFPSTVVGGKTMTRLCLCNTTTESKMILVENIDAPFEVRTQEFLLKGRWYINLRIYFRPTTSGAHFGKLLLSIDKDKILTYKLSGRAFCK